MLYIIPLFPLPELSSIVVPNVLSIFHWATTVVPAATDGNETASARPASVRRDFIGFHLRVTQNEQRPDW